MDQTDKMRKISGGSPQTGALYILRIATIILAVVSWWSTAQGMADYVFQEKWQAYLASLGVQGILLGLNFYLPTFWMNTMGSWPKRIVLAGLSLVTLCCSSVFTYIFISGYAYEDAWPTESRLLVQSGYRSELYDAGDYVDEYQDLLRNELGGQVSDLYTQAAALEAQKVSAGEGLNLEQDRTEYGENSDFAANSEVLTAILAIERAMADGASDSELQQAEKTLSSLEEQVNEQIAQLEIQIPQTQDAVDSAYQMVQQAQDQLNNAPAGSDITALQAAVNRAVRSWNEQQTLWSEQNQELNSYRTALTIIQRYQVSLVSASGGSTAVTAALREIQSGLLQQDIDTEDLANQARNIFEELQAAQTGSGAGDATYTDLLDGMDEMIRDIQAYAELKSSEETLDEQTEELSNASDWSGEDWKEVWTEKLDALKSAIGTLPAYSGTENSLLRNYDRTEAMDYLDDLSRLYIADHNAVDQAGIYLRSPNRGLALFSLAVAFFLDIAAFTVGFLIYLGEEKNKKEQLLRGLSTRRDQDDVIADTSFGIVSPATARRYLYLTGDYIRENERFYYKALDGENETEVVLDKPDFQRGFYLEDGGALAAASPQTLALYQMPNGPRDGIYLNCSLQYREPVLSIQEDGKTAFEFLASVGEEVPVYRMQDGQCVSCVTADVPPQKMQMVVLALNNAGTAVAAIYLIP